MSKEHSRHVARTERTWRRWNRGDLAILLCGVLAFMSMTFGVPLFHQLQVPASAGSAVSPAAGMMPPEPAPFTTEGPGAVGAGAAAEGQASPPASSGAPPVGPVLPAAAPPVRIRYASASFDVPVHALDLDAAAQASQTVEPPATKDGYWLTPFGTPGQGSANTTYVIGHSWEGADAPFNHLSSAAAVGDRFEVDTATGTIPYQVDSVTTYLKSSLKDSPIWSIVPNGLVLISCFTQDPWGKNVVVTASPVA
ncbi:Sortase family protein [Arthrobacter sp. 9AX]|uniref:class F sortase n=1 Tax=Arthrobacter sp. 9AX TaxID=2653131 RepID=UPI0012EF789F|nr:class F sortase [Arthrobacter sp. 9AX]VXA98042.1 Sortase family protein [Arthrobacter sp. 9AX]